MKIINCENTWMCQLNKPYNRVVLEHYKYDRDKSVKSLCEYYAFIITALSNTPAWGISGVNKYVNDLTDSVRSTISHSKTGKTSSYAHANQTLNRIDTIGRTEIEAKYVGRYTLKPLISPEELQKIIKGEE